MPLKTKVHKTSQKLLSLRNYWDQKDFRNPIIGILIFTALLYARAVFNNLTGWDDQWLVTFNKDIQSISHDTLRSIFTTYYNSMYHPLTMLSFSVEFALFGINPVAFHSTNVLIHLFNVFLVYYIFTLLSKKRFIAIVGAILFGIHPMHVESVAWVSERKDVLYGCFFLLALIMYIRYRGQKNTLNKYYYLTFLFFVCSILSKSAAIVLPLFFIVIDYYEDHRISFSRLKTFIPFYIVSLIFIYINFQSQTISTEFEVLKQYTILDRVFLASYASCFYSIHAFIPYRLSIIHLLPTKGAGHLPCIYYAAFLFPLVIASLLMSKRFRQPWLIFGLLFFTSGILLYLHIIPFGQAIVAERYTYIAYLGIYWIVGHVISIFLEAHAQYRQIIYALGFFIIALFSIITFERIGIWSDTITMFVDASKSTTTTKDSLWTLSYGYYLTGQEHFNAMEYQTAVSYFDTSLFYTPLYDTYINRGIANTYLSVYTAAYNDFSHAIQLSPRQPKSYANRGSILLYLGKQHEACEDFHHALDLGFYQIIPIMQANCP